MFRFQLYSTIADPLPSAAAELIVQSDAEAKVACLSKPSQAMFSSYLHHRSLGEIFAPGPVVMLHFLSCSAAIAKG
jgi:hypothetical protein